MKISVIIPIYKVERYLQQCVNSILHQTFGDWELILVDDGSPDSCPLICDDYIPYDGRVTVIHKKNRGTSDTRKCGIHVTTGEYILFIDGDDWLDLCAMEHCMRVLQEEHGTDCVIFTYVREYPQKSLPSYVMENSCVITGTAVKDQVYRRLFGLYCEELKHPERLENMGSCCMKLYHRALALKGRFFDTEEIGSCEDTLFNIYALSESKKVVYLNETLYHYRKAGQSITSSYRPNLIIQWNHLFELMEEAITEKNLGSDYREALQSRIALSVFGIGMNELSARDSFAQRTARVKMYIQSARYQTAVTAIALNHMPLPWRILLTFAKYSMSLPVCLELKAIDWVRKRL